ncbi:5-methyltetrahydropteroyltriglutamate--homocysteine S-methyltransferase [Microbispora sp. SCL1-1]|uniref:5-methyltetrahydropteroyltriglutamate-- homocysteine S-methyltransferase n=1 Tax=unclassified Microbispora TaxID=2614687 RepID=UPI00115B41DC|nr:MULTISPECIES: 5-methyltetrahydropteroyltriglutamate--homocysteine S-methyltransferase [unclassified Microbispora]NJP24930.1 5-methyltetrahydropteroyltriglutamate--homocysteine S-methyltransferase [Microbispora sp. CL1-1]TQS14381.1 5-methyltetrahydropteroyltriglutamate--homocysteine S-methyltransferase [Microbispora sp. SCL1-1]
MTSSFPASTVLGYPRIGPDRELKRALESYWEGRSSRTDLEETARRVREDTWRRLAALGLEGLPSNTFSYYDQVLDTAVLLGAVPGRYRHDDDLATYFAMARGAEGIAPLRMTKWFDTNYHYIVPEIGPDTVFSLDAAKPLGEVREARALGLETRPVLVGPVTFLLLSQAAPDSPDGFAPLDRLDDVVEVYARLLAELAAEGVGWVQLDEPALVADRTTAELAAVEAAYDRLGRLEHRPALLVASYFGDLGDALPVLAGAPVEAVALDLVRGAAQGVETLDVEALRGKTVVAGVVSGRDVWRTDRDRALATLLAVRERAGRVAVSTSCSLLHVPYDVERETGLDLALRERLAFAEQKVAEVVDLAARLAATPARDLPGQPAAPERPHAFPARTEQGRAPYPVRAAVQAEHLKLPLLPVTTIGSFPQTGELRRARAALAAGQIGEAAYESMVRAEIEQVIALQERLGLDVLVHGEPERNDMVQYFAEHLDGFAVTRHGWVQSYGSRCTRPPILYGDVRRPEPITVRWARYAQSLTSKPVKGMLTGPVTIVAWSFVRDDLPLREVVFQVADAVREEVGDLEEAGIRVIQVDEPALRELVPLRRAEQAAYLEWAVAAYRWATSGASEHTQIHTHLCYSDADEILAAIDALDADVTSIESARSRGRVLGAVGAFPRGLGPGVYDIHSPRVPDADEVEHLLAEALRSVPAERLWVNPDCGLKTRTYEQVEAALANVVEAAARLRERLF